MEEKPFERLVKTEHSALAFLKKHCWENYRRYCARCRSYQFYRISGNRYRCKRCGYTFHDFSGRWISKCRIGPRNWLIIIRFFGKGVSASLISKRIAQSYPTVLKALEVLRLAIIANSSDAKTWLDYLYFRPNEPDAKIKPQIAGTVFGILEQMGKVRIDILEGFMLEVLRDLNPKMLRRSLIYYTEEYDPYDALVFHDHTNASLWNNSDDSNRVYKVNGGYGFWSYVKSNISRYRGISKEKFPFYLKELEFRYNHRDRQIFELLCNYLVSFIPKS